MARYAIMVEDSSLGTVYWKEGFDNEADATGNAQTIASRSASFVTASVIDHARGGLRLSPLKGKLPASPDWRATVRRLSGAL